MNDRGRGNQAVDVAAWPYCRDAAPFDGNPVGERQYAVGVISAIDAGDRALAIIVGRAISGATAGYFFGSMIALLVAYRGKRAADA